MSEQHAADEAVSVPIEHIAPAVARALAEDLGTGDVSAALIDAGTRASATIVVREDAVLCGAPWLDEVFAQLGGGVQVSWAAHDAQPVQAGQELCALRGQARALLSGERTALNFLQTLSATASIARRYADAVAGTACRILDTRKTLPGLRHAQKYAVRCGGCHNHRLGLFDAYLIKENHIAAAGGIGAAVQRARDAARLLPIEVEAENVEQMHEAIEAGAQRVLLDNFTLAGLIRAVAENDGRVELEASGGITLENVRAIAETGIDFISVGALTKDLRAIDMSLRFA